ncbi:MAG: TIGR03668 family PPOX class F420-dependent oxidoreductase [Chloroflexota bacterium]|nr:TIGR03668 family PPOX class F420-dependent oxidoreductase [Chloroflexota bacterium]
MRPLTDAEAGLLRDARTAVLATIDSAGRPRLVPICFVVGSADDASPTIYGPIDDKPKRAADPHRLARVRDIAARPEVSLLVQRWDEDWSRLAWLRLHGTAALVEPDDPTGAAERTDAIAALRARYPQYAGHDLESRPLIRILLAEATSWSAGAEDAERR